MFDKYYSLAIEIKNMILSNLYYDDINIIYDDELDEYFISIHDENLYYSESYAMLVLKINQDILWKQGYFNFYFILDKTIHNINIAEKISFERKDADFDSLWGVHDTDNIQIESDIEFSDFSLAA
jgi:hypothetical protein